MIYNIVYDAVKKKAKTNPPNTFIGNVEMAAAIGIVIDSQGIELEYEGVEKPEEIREKFLEKVNKAELTGENAILYDLIERYQVKAMLNENIDDLITLSRDIKKHMSF